MMFLQAMARRLRESVALRLTVFGGAGMVLATVVYFGEPGRAGSWLPPCLFHKLTGLHCPGCGNTRALHALLHGDFAAALSHNLLMVPMGLTLLALLLRPRLASNHALCLTLALLVTLFFVARNLPWYPFTLLAP